MRATTMQAVIRRQARLVCDEIAEPVLGAGQVLLRTLTCGICGSDLHVHQHAERLAALRRRAGRPYLDPDRDIVFGHEFCGEILAHGPGTSRSLKAGTRVVALPYATGQSGRETVGLSNRFPGGLAERVCVDEAMLLAVPNGLSDIHAALTEPFAVGAHAVAQAQLDGDSVALVLGCGPVGLAVVAALKARGFGPVVAADFSLARRQAAERLGADILVDPAERSPHACWTELGVSASLLERDLARAAGRRAANPVVFECVGVPGMLQGILEGVVPGAQIIVVGVCMEEDRIEPSIAINKQLSFRFVAAYTPDEFARTLSDIAEGRIDVRRIASTLVGRAGVADAFDALKKPETQVKIVVETGRA
ncbi:MAG: zinc-binding dehydrogenase [Rhizomicrobium sp.]